MLWKILADLYFTVKTLPQCISIVFPKLVEWVAFFISSNHHFCSTLDLCGPCYSDTHFCPFLHFHAALKFNFSSFPLFHFALFGKEQTYVPWKMYENQENYWKSQFSYNMWILGIKHRLLGLVYRVLTHWTKCPTLLYFLMVIKLIMFLQSWAWYIYDSLYF